jgi:hypothetical protein
MGRNYSPPRGHRYIETNVSIMITDANNDNFQFRSPVDIIFIWDSPRASIVRHRYCIFDDNVSGRNGLLLIENIIVPINGAIDLIVYPENTNESQNMDMFSGRIPVGSIYGQCAINSHRGRVLRVQARQVSLVVSTTQTVSRSSSNSQSANLGGEYGGVSIGGEASRESSIGREFSRTRESSVGLGRFEMSQVT